MAIRSSVSDSFHSVAAANGSCSDRQSEIDMKGNESRSVSSSQSCEASDLVCGTGAVVLWCLPAIALLVGLVWSTARLWLWTPAFAIMGIACLANAARCRRLHCYFTGPIFLLAAAYAALAGFNVLPMRPGIVLGAVFGITILAFFAEVPFGRYRKRDIGSSNKQCTPLENK